MARQRGIFKLSGEMSGASFYKSSDDGYLVRQKGTIEANRIRTDPAFQRTRENGAEFGRAGLAGKLLRSALRVRIMDTADTRMASRLTQSMMKVVKSDLANGRGERNVLDGDLTLLNNFEFNRNGRLDHTFFTPYTTIVDRAAGNLSVSVPAFVPAHMVAAPLGATHCRLVAAAAAIDFETQTYVVTTSETAEIQLGLQEQEELTLDNAVTPDSPYPLFLAFGIEFYQSVNGQMYALNNGAYNALRLVAVSGL